MKHFGWIILTVSLATACDPADESLGDTGDTSTTDDSAGSTSGDTTGDPGSEDSSSTEPIDTNGCGDGGPGSQFELELGPQPIPPGTYTFELHRDSDDGVTASCDVTLPDGDGSCLYTTAEDFTSVTLYPNDAADLQAPMRLVITHSDVIIHDETREFDYEPIEDPCWSAGIGSGSVQLAAAQCDALETAFQSAHDEVRSCNEASECGTVISGFSCGCTRDWVGRLDTDPAILTDAAVAGVEGECGWAAWGGVCDCPEADGFDCIDNICTWNYIDQ